MKKEIVKVKFKFSFGKLKQLADGTLILIDRDIIEFSDRGFTPVRRTELVAAIDLFHNYPSDEQMDAIKQGATIAKDASRDILESKVRTMFLAAKNVFTENSAVYREFGNPDISHQSDVDFARNSKKMVATAQKYALELAVEGITAVKIEALDMAQKKFDLDIDLQDKAVDERDNSTENRAKIANTLYDLIVKYCETGKDIWYETSEAKYNDYVIYNTASGSDESGDEDELTGTVAPNSVKSITTIDEDAMITMSNTGTDKLYFALSAIESPGSMELEVAAGGTLTKSTADMSPDGDGTYLLVKNPSSTEIGSYTVVIEF